MVTRSSLELMLDKLQQLEEQPADIPPPLPVRPVSRARPARLPRPLAAPYHRFLEKTQNLEERPEKGICKIQKWYRGHQVRRCYRELTRGVITLQSFIRGRNATRGFQQRCRFLSAIIIIQKQGRKYLQHQAAALTHLQSGDGMHPDQIKRRRAAEDQTGVPYTYLVDLEKRGVRTEAKLRAKKEENAALKTKLLEMEKKWQQREERMASMEKEWQDQLTYIQKCLAAAKKNHTLENRFSNRFQNPDNIPTNSNNSDVDEDEGVCIKLRPHEELQKLRVRFKEWKKEYKNKLRDAQSTFKKLGNTHTSKTHKKWWGRLSN